MKQRVLIAVLAVVLTVPAVISPQDVAAGTGLENNPNASLGQNPSGGCHWSMPGWGTAFSASGLRARGGLIEQAAGAAQGDEGLVEVVRKNQDCTTGEIIPDSDPLPSE